MNLSGRRRYRLWYAPRPARFRSGYRLVLARPPPAQPFDSCWRPGVPPAPRTSARLEPDPARREGIQGVRHRVGGRYHERLDPGYPTVECLAEGRRVRSRHELEPLWKPSRKVGSDELLHAIPASQAQPEQAAFPLQPQIDVEKWTTQVLALGPFRRQPERCCVARKPELKPIGQFSDSLVRSAQRAAPDPIP